MNNIKQFMELFDSKRTMESWQELTDLLKDCSQYFKNVPTSIRGAVLSLLFHETKGLLAFIKDAIDRPHIDNNLQGAIFQAADLLSLIIKTFADDYKPYMSVTLDVLTFALSLKFPIITKQALAKTFETFVKEFQTSDLDFNSTVEDWMKKLHLCKTPERRLLLHALCVVMLHFPQTAAFNRYSKKILRQLVIDWKEMYEPGKKNDQISRTYIEALSHILCNFPPSEQSNGTDSLSSVYALLKNVCALITNMHNKNLMIEVINLLAKHLSLFSDYVYEDFEFWYKKFNLFVNHRLYEAPAMEALKKFYEIMGNVLKNKNSPESEQVFFKLHNYFLRNLANDKISSIELQLSVYGLSQIFESGKNHLSAERVNEIFSLIAHRTIPLYSRINSDVTQYEEIADYQEALSKIIRHSENVSIEQTRALTRLCTVMMKHFPDLLIADQKYAILALNKTIINIQYTKEILYQDFITNIVYEGISWSCSHMLQIDAELKLESTEEEMQQPITYKDYLPLWQGLLNPENYSKSENSEIRRAALQMVVDEIIKTCINFINTLNVRVTTRNGASEDSQTCQVPENPTDFRIFLNVVDLYVDILPSIEHFLWSNLLHEFLYELVRNSYKSPLISGFYKLVNITLTSCEAFQRDTFHGLANKSFELILHYLWIVMDSLPSYPQELQISCLQLILNVPEIFIPHIVNRATPTFRVSLTLGLTNFEIATTAMTALERWREFLNAESTKNFISQIVPCLEAYLQSKDSNFLLQDIEESERRGTRAKRVTLVDDEQTMEGFQRRILLFFGSLGSDAMLEHIHKRSLKTGATWSEKDLLRYEIPFADMDLSINLDEMLPRIIELALSAGDRQTRIAASDVLHTFTSFVLGKTKKYFSSFDNNRFAPIYKTLCPALLRLGCDSDDVVMQIYDPLVIQLTHWLSMPRIGDNLATIYLIDALFDGLCNETNSSLREASGLYIAEFVRWSIKQSSNQNLAQGSKHVDLIVGRIVNFALDPSGRKRVAAAIAFNSLYRIIREDEDTVSIFWLKILYAFVKSLEGFSDARIYESLRHVERVLVEKSRIFNRTNAQRKRPPGFCGTKIANALVWIFQQCGSTDRNCRRKCMEIFMKLSSTVDNANSPRAMISEYVRDHSISGLHDILLRDLDTIFCWSNQELCLFQRSLELYTWLIRDDLVDREILFTDLNPRRSLIFDAIENFVLHNITRMDSMEMEEKIPENPRESADSRNLVCELIVDLFDFILTILDVMEQNPDHVPSGLFSDNFFSLVSGTLVKPEKLGFDSSNLQLTEKLPVKLIGFLEKSTKRGTLPPEIVDRMRQIFITNVDQYFEKLFQIEEMLDSKDWINENVVRGLVYMQRYGALRIIDEEGAASVGLTKIFDALKKQELNRFVCCYPRLEAKSYLCQLVELSLVDADAETIKRVVDFVTNPDKLWRSDMTTVNHGEYFFSLFSDEIGHVFLSNIETTLDRLVNRLRENPESALRTLESIVQHLYQNRNRYAGTSEKIADSVIERHEAFERSTNNLEYRKNIIFNAYAMIVRLRKSLLNRDCSLSRWIFREFDLSNDFKYRVRLLRDFLVCLADENLEESPELEARLTSLRNHRGTIISESETEKRKASTETIDCFQQLSKLLPITRSKIVLDGVINFSAGIGDVVCEENLSEYLKLYYNVIKTESVLKSLEMTYKRFKTCASSDRLDILRYFLMPSLSYCNPETIEKFFQANIHEMCEIVMEKPTENVYDRKQLFISKIGCYNLIEILFARVSRDKIDPNGSPNNLSSRLDGKKSLYRVICQNALSVRQLTAIVGDDEEIFRLLHCAAYKCCIAIVCTEPDDRLYVALFTENETKSQYIWKNIIDVNRKYDLRQTSKEYPKQREKLVNIRKAATVRESKNNYSYVKSYDLATSTLNENLYAYDLNAVNILPQRVEETGNETMSLRLEIDDLNEHECMHLICGFFKHAGEKDNSQGERTDLPMWLSNFCASMMSEYENVRLFLLKIILNSEETFHPYAKYFLGSVTSVLYRLLRERESLNYVVTDAIVMLVGWREIHVPTSEEERKLARRLFPLFVKKSLSAPTKFIVRYNLSVIEMLVDAWHDCLDVPEKLEELASKEDRSALKLVLIFLTKRMHERVVVRDDIWSYVVECLADWKIKEESVLKAFEAAGLMLECSTGNREERKCEIIEAVTSSFRLMQVSHPGRLVKCLHSLTRACNELAIDFFQFVSATQLRVPPTSIAMCLDIFLLVLPRMSSEELVKALSCMRFGDLLEKRVVVCEKACLLVVSHLVDYLEAAKISGLVKHVASYSSHEVLDYRQLCYETFSKVHKKYSNFESSSSELEISEIRELVDLSRRVLLSGLLETSEDVKKYSLDFWSEVTESRDKSSERLLLILDAYDCGIGTNFLQAATLMLLELTRKSVKSDKKLFEPLFECAYREHEISVSWKSRNYESRIPLFAPSVASRLSQRFTQRSNASYGGSMENYVRSIDGLEFEPTYVSPANPEDEITEGGIFAVPKVPELPRKTSRRFLEDWSKVTKDIQKRIESKRRSEEEKEREYHVKRRGKVKIYRKYRTGDFPDIEISHLTLLSPMQELIKRDIQLCQTLMKILTTSLINLEANTNEDYGKEVSERFAKILEEERENEAFVATILEIFFNVRSKLRYSGSSVMRVARKDGLLAEGAILVEQELMEDDSEPPRTKRLRTEVDRKKERWVRLATLYESMDEIDPVLGIFRNEMFSEELHLASLSRANNDWARAKKFYCQAREAENDEETKLHCLRGTYECLARLGDWTNLEKEIARNTSGIFELLTPGSDDSQWTGAWSFRAHTQRILENRGNERFVLEIQSHLNDAASYQRLKENYGEKTAIILLCTKQPEIARDLLNGSLEKTRQRWLRLSPLAVSLRSRAVVKLRGICDIDRYLRVLGDSDILEASRRLVRSWEKSVPSVKDDLLFWDIHVSYRLRFSDNLKKMIEITGSPESQENKRSALELFSVKISQMQKLIDCSLEQKNCKLATKYLKLVEQELDNCEQKIVDEFELSAVRYKFLEAKMTTDEAKSLRSYCLVWKTSHKMLNMDSLTTDLQIAIRQVISEVSESLARMSIERTEFFDKLMNKIRVVQETFVEQMHDNVTDSLNNYSLSNLLKCCSLAPRMAECHSRLSRYCYERISRGNTEWHQLSKEFVRSTLRAMSCGSEEATYYFPCLLRESFLSSDEIREIFKEESTNVETWRFLIWQPQLLAHLATGLADCVAPIVRRIIDNYPNAVLYSVRLALDTSVTISGGIWRQELRDFLANNRDFDRFYRALEYVVSPRLHMEYHLREFSRNCRKCENSAFDRLMEKLYPEDLDTESTLQGEFYHEVAAKLKSEVEKLSGLPRSEVEKHVSVLLEKLNKLARKPEQKRLSFFSPWLSNYVGHEIEVPGQYKINSRPIPRYHAKIIKLESTVEIMQSIRKPIRIKLIASDGRNYNFLVKFGEDLRLDQRVEQVFEVMNEKLKSEAACSRRRLSIDTYQVFPLSGNLGLIEWIEGTKTLGEYVNFSADKIEKEKYRYIEREYKEWIKKAAPEKSLAIQHKEALIKYNADDVRARMQEFIGRIRSDTLRKSFIRLSSCMKEFMCLRQNFTSSYATMCIGQWILGIGDRHLGNTLVAVESGRCIGIDFGSAFGGGLDQSVPELMPFRLTSQIKGLVEPFSEYDSMGVTMVHVLRALKNSKGSLLACLDVVAHEQLNWLEHMKRLPEETESSDVQWIPENKVRIVCEKLDGGNPSMITLRQLAEHHSDEPYFSQYVAIVNGTDENSERSSFGEKNLSPEEQVQCLVKQAIDLNVLGRAYAGWSPWL